MDDMDIEQKIFYNIRPITAITGGLLAFGVGAGLDTLITSENYEALSGITSVGLATLTTKSIKSGFDREILKLPKHEGHRYRTYFDAGVGSLIGAGSYYGLESLLF